jgi:hypothetical protein
VKGIPALLLSHDLVAHFRKYAGTIADIYFPKSNMEDGERSQYCFISFVEPTSVQLAVSSAPHIINGLRIGPVGMCVCVCVCVFVCTHTHTRSYSLHI